MLRDLIVNGQDAAIAGYKVAAAAATGMGVVISDEATKTVAFPGSATATDIFVLYKSKVPTGINCAKTEFSDYDPEFNTFEAGEQCILRKYDIGERFAVDAYASGLVAGDAGKKVNVGTDGKWAVAGANATSKYVFLGFVTDNGHQLARIKVVEDTTANS